MKIYGIYFSPTGGTKKILDILMDRWKIEKELIDLTIPHYNQKRMLNQDDICMIAIPSYGGRVPKIVLKRLENIKGNQTKTVLIAVYGNRAYDDTLLELKNVMKDNGFNPVAAISAVAKHSIMNKFANDRPNSIDQMELQVFSKEIMNLINTKKNFNDLKVPGDYPYRKYNGVPFKPKGNRLCNSCGICAKSCPLLAIPLDKPKQVDRSKCISCMHCVKVCPNQARQINPIILKLACKLMEKNCFSRKENQLFFEME